MFWHIFPHLTLFRKIAKFEFEIQSDSRDPQCALILFRFCTYALVYESVGDPKEGPIQPIHRVSTRCMSSELGCIS